MDVFPKFIIETDNELGDCLIIAKVTYHGQIVTDKNKVKGGGWYRFSNDKKEITFYGKSEDFGRATLEDIKACVISGNVYTDLSIPETNIANDFKFFYDRGSEIVPLN